MVRSVLQEEEAGRQAGKVQDVVLVLCTIEQPIWLLLLSYDGGMHAAGVFWGGEAATCWEDC